MSVEFFPFLRRDGEGADAFLMFDTDRSPPLGADVRKRHILEEHLACSPILSVGRSEGLFGAIYFPPLHVSTPGAARFFDAPDYSQYLIFFRVSSLGIPTS